MEIQILIKLKKTNLLVNNISIQLLLFLWKNKNTLVM